MGGIRYITGWQDRPPLRIGLSLGDSIAGLYAVIGALMAVHEARSSGQGQVVDVALNESVMTVLESIIPEYGFDGRVRERMGNLLNNAAPSNTYQTADGHWLAIGANGDSIFRRLCTALERPEMGTDPRYQGNQKRREHVDELDKFIGGWVGSHTLEQAMEALNANDVPAGPVYSVADMAADPQFQARNMLMRVADERLGSILMPGVVPRLSRTPGEVRWAGKDLGADDAEVLAELDATP
jgi:crotonobetainyl-CoA:carnitine CoA-transferase CaiB-like acyl-CoA transferase